MRRSLLAVGAIVATVGLASCSSGSTKATIDQYVASFGAQPYAQLHLTLSAGGVGSDSFICLKIDAPSRLATMTSAPSTAIPTRS